MADLWVASLIALWLIVLAMGFLLAGALRQIGLFQLRLGDDVGALITDAGLNRGTLAPDFEGLDRVTGATVHLSELPAQRRVLAFVSPACLACRQLAPHLNEVMATRAKEFGFLVVCSGDAESCLAFANKYKIGPQMLVDETNQALAKYDVHFTPFVYLLDEERRVLLRGVANNWVQLESLLEQEGSLQGGRVLQKIGEPISDLQRSARDPVFVEE